MFLGDRSVHKPEIPYYMQLKQTLVHRGETQGQRMVFQDHHFNFDFGVKELLNSHHTAVELRATALYGYARYVGDTDVTRTYLVSNPDVTWVIKPGIWNGVKNMLTRARGRFVAHEYAGHLKHVEESGIDFEFIPFPWVCKWPSWMLPKAHKMDSIRYDEYDVKVDRIQEALISQITMLYHLNLPPRAVLASQNIAEYLLAADMGMEKDSPMNVPTVGNDLTFMGLPVIVCREMAHGAIVI